MSLDVRRLSQVCRYGWRHSGKVQDLMQRGSLYRLHIFADILYCYARYRVWSNQYMEYRLYNMDKVSKKEKCKECMVAGKERDVWQKDFRNTRKFLMKYGNIKYEKYNLRDKRNRAYTQRYNTGMGLMVENNVNISRQHYLNGTIKIGKNVTIAKNVFIDYSGEVIIGDDVKLANGVIIESHTHPIFGNPAENPKVAVPTRIIIEDGVCLASNSIVLDSCSKIGRYARIGAGAVIRNSVPPYAIMVGNPAKIVGFVYNPEQVQAFEDERYKEGEKTPIAEYGTVYEKYFYERLEEIMEFLKS